MNRDMNLDEQISFEPSIVNSTEERFQKFLVCGMGGSGFPARALLFLNPSLPVTLHSDFGAPEDIDTDTLCVAVSYSGNTAETLSFAKEILARKLSLAVITSGGELLEMTKVNGLQHIVVPGGLLPRDALLYLLKSLAFTINTEDVLSGLGNITVDEAALTKEGERLSEDFHGVIPLIYSSTDNATIGYLWNTLTEEFAKIPVFTNIFPELSHNELEAIVAQGKSANLTGDLRILLIHSEGDDKRIEHEMTAFTDLASSHGTSITSTNKLPEDKLTRLIHGWIMARGFALALAKYYGVLDPGATPIIDELKKKL